MPNRSRRTSGSALLSAHGRIADRIDRDLIDDAELTLAEFEVLDHLAEQPRTTPSG